MNPRRDEIIRALVNGEVSGNLAPVQPGPQRPVNPRCAEHCRACHVEADLTCTACGAVSYRLVAHEHATGDPGHYWYTTTPLNGAPALAARQIPKCHRCGGSLSREAPGPL